jgi:2-dehydrotetronate isomerase
MKRETKSMPKFAANLTMMYTEHDFLDRFAAAAKDGFRAVEFLFPYDYAAQDIKQRLKDHNLTQALFNAPPGDWSKGERGIASLPGREEEFKQSVAKGLEYAAVLGNEKLHIMAGLIAPTDQKEAHREIYKKNLEYAAKEAQKANITIVIEPINTRDIPGFFLNRQDDAQAVCDEIGAPNLQVQFDIYHCQIVEGDIAMKLKRDMKRPNAGIGHIQIAGVPERHEPGIGELNYPYLFELIDSLGYDGYIGCEYKPKAGTSEGLGWLKPYL